MNQALSIQSTGPSAQAIENVLIGGDLAKLAPEQRLTYYKQVCESVGLNPLTRPFEYIILNGRMVLYARKDATDQLRASRRVSIYEVQKELMGEILVVTAKGRDASGREDTATGAVNLAGLKGEALANAYMKGETKAKRRLTLSICGLGMLDETEVESIPEATRPAVEQPRTGRIVAEQPSVVDGNPEMEQAMYRIPSGSMKGRLLSEVPLQELRKHVEDVEAHARVKGSMGKQAKEFVDRASKFIADIENTIEEGEFDGFR